jgi:hypothetical protein
LINKKYFIAKKKLDLVSNYFERKTLFKNYEKFRNVILFADYIKFNSQIFDCYIFYFEFFFQFYPLEFDLI